MTLLSDPLLQHVLALAFATLFGLAAVHKWAARKRFAAALGSYGVPAAWTGVVGALLASVETLICAGLVWPPTRQVAGGGAVAALFAYALVLARAVNAGREIVDCGCGMGAPQAVHPALVLRNLGLSIAAGLLLLAPVPRDLGGLDVLVGAAALVTLFALYLAVSTLLGSLPRIQELAREGGTARG